jgi:hypothetical protein
MRLNIPYNNIIGKKEKKQYMGKKYKKKYDNIL